MREIPSPGSQENQKYTTSESIPLGEPVTRPDGIVIQLKTSGDNLIVEHFSNATYSYDEVEALGNGDWRAGSMRIAQAYYKADKEQLLAGNFKLFKDELAAHRLGDK